MMKRIITTVFCLLSLLWVSCRSILEKPVDGGVDPTVVQVGLILTVDPAMGDYASAVKAETADAYDVRWVVEIFQDRIGGTLVERRVLSCDPAVDGAHSITTEFTLHASKYVVVAWMDYVDDGSVEDKFYCVDDLSCVTWPDLDHYVGDEPYKDAYVGQQELDLSIYRDQWNQQTECTMTLERPMALFELVTTDVDQFLEQQTLQSALSATRADGANSDLSSLRVTVDYDGYFPTSYNVYADKPNDAQTGISFDSSIALLDGGEGHMTSDYVFVNGSESAVTVTLSIRDQNGTLLNTVSGIQIPIVRGMQTVIHDNFLTKISTPGLGIDTGFDGEIEVVIPD